MKMMRSIALIFLSLIIAAMMVACENPENELEAPVASDYAAQYDLDSTGNYTFGLDLKGASAFEIKIGDIKLVSDDYIHDKIAKTLSLLSITLQTFAEGKYTVSITTDGGSTSFEVEFVRANEVVFDGERVSVNTLALTDIVKEADFGALSVQAVRFNNDNMGSKVVDPKYWSYDADARKFTLKKEYLYQMYEPHYLESKVEITLSNLRRLEFGIGTNLDYYNDYETRTELEQPILFNHGLTDTASLVDGWDGKALSVAGNGGMIFIGAENTETTGASVPYGDVRFLPGHNYRLSFEFRKNPALEAPTTTLRFRFKDSQDYSDVFGNTSVAFKPAGGIDVKHDMSKPMNTDTINTTITYDEEFGFARVVINIAVPSDTKGQDGYLFAAEPGYKAGETDTFVQFAWLFDNFRVEEIPAVESLMIKSNPTKTEYDGGDMFDATGLVLTVNYADDVSEDLTTGFTLSPTTITTGTESVVAAYLGKTVNIPVTVVVPAILKTYVYGSDLELSADREVASVYQGETQLVKDRDYAVDGTVLTLKKGYLNTLEGVVPVTVNYADSDTPVIYEVSSGLTWVHSQDYEGEDFNGNSAYTNTGKTRVAAWDGQAVSIFGNGQDCLFGWGNPWKENPDHNGAYGDIRFNEDATFQFSFDIKLDTSKNPIGNKRISLVFRNSKTFAEQFGGAVVIEILEDSAKVVTSREGVVTMVTFYADEGFARVTCAFQSGTGDNELYIELQPGYTSDPDGNYYAWLFDNIGVAKVNIDD